MMDAADIVASHAKQSQDVNSQMKDLEKNRTQFNKKTQASYDKLLKNQDKQNKELTKSNEKSAKEWGKLHKSNDMMQLKLSHMNDANMELLDTMKERKANLTAALA